MKHVSAAVVFGLLIACSVEPPVTPPRDVGPRDADIMDAVVDVDSGTPDTGLAICSFREDCAALEICEDGSCVAEKSPCQSSSECAAGRGCAIQFEAFSRTATTGACQPNPFACSAGGDCAADEACLAAGVCARRASAIRGVLDVLCFDESDCGPGETAGYSFSPDLVATCSEAADCGPAGICTGDACVGCSSSGDCPGTLLCVDGACAERANCGTDADCFAGNTCAGGVCTRDPSGCNSPRDASNSALAPTPIVEGSYGGLQLCGDEAADWFTFDIARERQPSVAEVFSTGARIVVKSDPREASIAADVFDDFGGVLEDATYLVLPGTTIIQIPPPLLTDNFEGDPVPFIRSIQLRISSKDVKGDYAFDVSFVTPLCPPDALDMYGDEAADALVLADGASLFLFACPNDVDAVGLDVGSGDQIQALADFRGGDTDLDLALLNPAGTQVAPPAGTPPEVGTSTETLMSARLAAAGQHALQVSARVAPPFAQPYLLETVRVPGARFDVCETPTDLAFAGGVASVDDDLVAAVDLGSTDCDPFAPSARNDRIYRVVPTTVPALLTLDVTHRLASDSRLAVALLDNCVEGTTIACDDTALPRRASHIERVLESAEPIWVMVSSDGPSEDVGFSLTATLEPLVTPANDACFGAVDLAASGSVEVTTYGAVNDVELTASECGYFDDDGQGRDRFYSITLGTGERAALELSGPRGGFLWAAENCAQMTTTCTAAQDISFDDPTAKITLSPRTPRTFFVAVDGLRPEDQGTYQLRTVRGADLECLSDAECGGDLRCADYRCVPVPANDVCDGDLLALDGNGFASVSANTSAANQTYALECAGSAGRDLVYRVVLPQDRGRLTARITDASFDPALAIRSGQCASSENEVCNDDVVFGEILLPEATLENPEAGVYFIIVDAFAGSGNFTLEVEAAP